MNPGLQVTLGTRDDANLSLVIEIQGDAKVFGQWGCKGSGALEEKEASVTILKGRECAY